jgi:GT2 family glycosyltransferase
MLEHVQRPEVGAVGARLLYPDGTLQHGGVIIGVGSVAGHAQKRLGKDEAGYFSRAKVIQNFSAVTAACLMVRAETFRELRGFNEDNLPVAFNDVDFCLRVRERDLLIVWTPFAELIHNESVSRGHDNTPEKVARFRREMQYMRRRWSHVIQNDPYYNPNLSLEVEDFSIAPFSRYCS